MICGDILEIEDLKELELVAGQKGLYRHVRWLYFADSMRVVNDTFYEDPEKYSHWIQGGELMVITNEDIIQNDEFVGKLVYNSEEKCASGIIIQKDKTTPFLMNLANEKNIPLFELPWTIRLIDLSQIISTRIVNEKNIYTSLESLLSSILYGNYSSEEDVIKMGLTYHFDFGRECVLARIEIRDRENEEYIKNLIRNAFDNQGIRYVIVLPEPDGLLVLFPSDTLDQKQIQSIFVSIGMSYWNKEKVRIQVGISLRKNGILQYKEARNEALLAVKFADDQHQYVQWYRNLGIYKVLGCISQTEPLYAFYQEILGKLEVSDSVSHGNLCETLKVYMDCNCNALDASKRLYIHRNTMRYRLNKIEEILDISLNDMHTLFLLDTAFEIKYFLTAMKS